MVIHVEGGKGRKNRDLMLSTTLLEELRADWRRLRRKPEVWLFPGGVWHRQTPRRLRRSSAIRRVLSCRHVIF
jgi:integrase